LLKNLFSSLKQKCLKNEWSKSLESPVLKLYKECKHVFGYEKYLDILPRGLRFYFCRLRLSVHPLRMQTGRYDRPRTEPEDRYCLCCDLRDLEDEYHFVCICPCYMAIRKKYLRKDLYDNPSMFKFINYLNSQNKIELVNLSSFVKDALAIRNSKFNIIR